MQGAQILRNEAYLWYAAVTRDAVQCSSWTFYEAIKLQTVFIPGALMKTYIHKELDQEVRSISGEYRFISEERLPCRGKEALCLVGVGQVDNSCCGVTGCIFVRIPGYIVAWQNGLDDGGRPTTDVEPITDEREQEEITRLLQQTYPSAQVYFTLEQ